MLKAEHGMEVVPEISSVSNFPPEKVEEECIYVCINIQSDKKKWDDCIKLRLNVPLSARLKWLGHKQILFLFFFWTRKRNLNITSCQN